MIDVNDQATAAVAKLVTKLEDARFVAMLGRDLSTLQGLLADDLIYIHSTGVVQNKEGYLKALRGGDLIYEEVTTEDREVSLLSPTAALIHGSILMKLRVKGEGKTVHSIFINSWRLVDRDWQMVSWQSTSIP
jgi:hypothetical protein